MDVFCTISKVYIMYEMNKLYDYLSSSWSKCQKGGLINTPPSVDKDILLSLIWLGLCIMDKDQIPSRCQSPSLGIVGLSYACKHTNWCRSFSRRKSTDHMVGWKKIRVSYLFLSPVEYYRSLQLSKNGSREEEDTAEANIRGPHSREDRICQTEKN